jgi:hypothetical protein
MALTLVFKFILLFPTKWHCERLSPLGTAATTDLLYQPQMIKWWWLWSNWWNEDWQGNPKYSEKTCPSATLSTTKPIWPDPGLNPDHRDGKPTTNLLSYDTTPKWHCEVCYLYVSIHMYVWSNGCNKRVITHLQNKSARSKTHAKFILDWYTLHN